MPYTVIGSDGKEYGPVEEAQLRQWLSEGRVLPDSAVRDFLTGQTKRVSDIVVNGQPPVIAAPPGNYAAYPLAPNDPAANTSILPLAYSVFQSVINLLCFYLISGVGWGIVFTLFSAMDLLRSVALLRRGSRWGNVAVMIAGITFGMILVGWFRR